MQNQWIYKNLNPVEDRESKALSAQFGMPEQLARMLVQRGVHTFEQAQDFLRPDMQHLHSPFEMKDMDKAVDRLNAAMRNKEGILIYGDYDVDGVTAVALVYKFLKPYTISGQKIGYYIPDRYKDGYGVSRQGIDFAANHGMSLIITLDFGIKAHEQVQYAAEKGIDVIICDHHTTDDTLPAAVAVLDPKRVDDPYPYKDLSGCGVGFKFMHAFAISNEIPFATLEKELDLLAVSIASDIVPITGENRILAHYGIKQLNENPSCGLKAIIDLCNIKSVTISDIVFKIGPRINASGRICSGKEVVEIVELLVATNIEKAYAMSRHIDTYNEERRSIDKRTTTEAVEQLKASAYDLENRRSIVVYNPEWNKGVVAIVASRLTEEYYKPTIVLTKDDDLITGSARSVQGFDLYSAIDSCRDLLENFGGHTYAAGLSMREENLAAFIERFEDYVTRNITSEQLRPQIEIDAEICFADITPKFLRVLRQFEPYGPCNPKPLFCTRDVYDYNGSSKIVGHDREHLKLELTDSSSGNVMNGIAFRMAQYADYLKALNPLDIIYSIEENNFNGSGATQLMIKDIRKR